MSTARACTIRNPPADARDLRQSTSPRLSTAGLPRAVCRPFLGCGRRFCVDINEQSVVAHGANDRHFVVVSQPRCAPQLLASNFPHGSHIADRIVARSDRGVAQDTQQKDSDDVDVLELVRVLSELTSRFDGFWRFSKREPSRDFPFG